MRTVRRRIGSLAIIGAFVLGSCSGDSSLPGEIVGEVEATTTTVAPTFETCSDAEKAVDATPSYPALAELPEPGAFEDDRMQEIYDRGRLIVGVSGDTLLFGARNPQNGQIEGFDVDMLKELSLAIFGDENDRIEYRVLTYAQRLPSLESRAVDVVAHTMTINCDRWLRIAFSSEYFAAGQKVLVSKASGYESIDDLATAKATVCAPEGSTNIDELRTNPAFRDITVVGEIDISDCLVAMQQGKSDAITGDDTVMAGFAAQDPTTVVVGEQFTQEPYGLGFNRADTYLVQFANTVLDEMRANGRWTEIYQRWLIDTGALQGPIPDPPAPNDDREFP